MELLDPWSFLYDLYVSCLCRSKQPTLADNLEKNNGVNLTNLPFASQPLDARHEEINKKGQNMFKGEEVEDFQLELNNLNLKESPTMNL